MSTTVKKLVVGFETEGGNTFSLSLTYALPELTTDASPVDALITYILTNQPFEVTLSSCLGADIIETTTTELTLTPAA